MRGSRWFTDISRTVVATVSKQWVALTDTYGVDTAGGEDDILILAVVLAIDLEDVERRSD